MSEKIFIVKIERTLFQECEMEIQAENAETAREIALIESDYHNGGAREHWEYIDEHREIIRVEEVRTSLTRQIAEAEKQAEYFRDNHLSWHLSNQERLIIGLKQRLESWED